MYMRLGRRLSTRPAGAPLVRYDEDGLYTVTEGYVQPRRQRSRRGINLLAFRIASWVLPVERT